MPLEISILRIAEQMCMLQTPQFILARAMCACDCFASVICGSGLWSVLSWGLIRGRCAMHVHCNCNSMIVVYRACADSLRCAIAEGSIEPVEQGDCQYGPR